MSAVFSCCSSFGVNPNCVHVLSWSTLPVIVDGTCLRHLASSFQVPIRPPVCLPTASAISASELPFKVELLLTQLRLALPVWRILSLDSAPLAGRAHTSRLALSGHGRQRSWLHCIRGLCVCVTVCASCVATQADALCLTASLAFLRAELRQ
eukprot:3037547-Rhodomonas_salina.2